MSKAGLLFAVVAVIAVSCSRQSSQPPQAAGSGSTATPPSAASPAPTITPAPAAPATPGPDAATAKKLEISDENAELIQHLGSYPNLEVLSIHCVEELRAFPDSIGQLTKLKELRIDNGNGCAMNPVLPEAMGNLQSLETLVLYGAQDPGRSDHDHQPAHRHKFPRSMSQLKNLTQLNLGRNGLEQVPAFVKDLPQLRRLNLDFNDLNDLPEFLSAFPRLTVSLENNCDITGNEAKKEELRRRFPKITFDFENEYDCPEQST